MNLAGRRTFILLMGLAAALLAGAEENIGDAFRGPDGDALFGPRQEAPADASNADRLAAFLDRFVEVLRANQLQ